MIYVKKASIIKIFERPFIVYTSPYKREIQDELKQYASYIFKMYAQVFFFKLWIHFRGSTFRIKAMDPIINQKKA